MGIKDILSSGWNSDSLENVFAEEPVNLSTFVQDRQFLNNPPLSPIQYEVVRHIERIYLPDLYPKMGVVFDKYWAEPVRMTNFIVVQWGKGSGKDHVCRVAALRIAYLLMCMKSPQEYFSMPAQDTIHILNVAPAARQADQAFFHPMVKAVKRGWFDSRCDAKGGVGVISFHKGIEAISGHADADSQEGLNLIAGFADEIDAFKSKQEFMNRNSRFREPTKSAEAIMEMINSSGRSRFETFKSVQISFPRYIGSTIQRLTREAKEDIALNKKKSKYYVSGPLATWEVNPNYDKYERVQVPGTTHMVPSNLLDAYIKDVGEAQSKYECRPSPAFSPYFRNLEAIDACFNEVARPPIQVTYRTINSSESVAGVVWDPVWDFDPTFVPIAGAAYTMHGDLSVTSDRAGIAMAHCVNQKLYEDVTTNDAGEETFIRETRPFVKVDFIVPFTSDMSKIPQREIQISWAMDLALELIKRGFNIRQFTFDGWQCLSGDTEIPLLNGTTKTMKELAGSEPFWVYSCSEEGRIVPGLCTKAWKTGYREDMFEVELDNGEIIKATSNHPFMLRDGSYRRVDELSIGDSLMPLYRKLEKISKNGGKYEKVYHPKRAELGNEEFKVKHNHKVVAIRHSEPEEVYDLEVEDFHNFATNAGVFVHNSLDMMQRLQRKGIDSYKVSTDRGTDNEVYKNFRDLMYEGRVKMPYDELLKQEILRLTQLPNGKIDHVRGFSKDLSDAVACAALGAVKLGGQESESGERAYFDSPSFSLGPKIIMPTALRNVKLDRYGMISRRRPDSY